MYTDSKYILIYCTTPDTAAAESIAEYLVDHRLAACCNILPGITSVYRWKNNIERDKEVLLLVKTTSNNFVLIEKAITDLHPYEVPEIIATDISKAAPSYLNWLRMSVDDGCADAT